MPKKLTEQDARDLISSKIKSIKDEKGIEIEFLGFLNNTWIGNTTKLILKLENKIWDTTNFNSFTSKGVLGKHKDKLTESDAIKEIENKCKEISTKNEIITFHGFSGPFEGWTTRLKLKNSIYGEWNNTNIRNFLQKGVSKPNRLNEIYAKQRVLEICNKISTPDETIIFKGWNGIFNGANSKLILYNSKQDIEWDTCVYNDFINYKPKFPKLTKEIALIKIERLCKELSSPEEIITFHGFNGEWVGNKTKLILHNTKYNRTWDTTSYDGFINQHSKTPTLYSVQEHYERILNLCQKVSTPDEILVFKGWKNGEWLGNHNTYLILYNSKYNITWETTSYMNFIQSQNKLPNGVLGRSLLDKETFKKAYGFESSTLEEFIEKYEQKFPIPQDRYDLSEANYTSSSEKFKVICHQSSGGIEHGAFWITPSNLLSGYGCPYCSGSKGELRIKNYFDFNNITYSTQYCIPISELNDCPNKERILVDFYLEYKGRKIFIEFNGPQHYEFSSYFQKSFSEFEDQLKRDESLREYSKSKGIELLEIPYNDINRIPEILDKFLDSGENITTKTYRKI